MGGTQIEKVERKELVRGTMVSVNLKPLTIKSLPSSELALVSDLDSNGQCIQAFGIDILKEEEDGEIK